MEFRLEINGLRAIAVGLVMLFHFRVPPFAGGFVGVDVFFVISGFLMTKIIMGRLGGENFSVWRFYLERMRRLIPALATMVAILLCFCWFFVEPGTFAETGARSAAALTFVSNIMFASDAGYFAEASESNLLLHTWSLSVEWQFYILYPIFLLLMYRLLQKERVGYTFVALAVLSFAISLYMISKGGRWPASAYFLLPSRAWEMLFGGAAYLVGNHAGSLTLTQRRALELAGVGAIVASALLYNTHTPWPSYPTLIPIAGSALIILANGQQSSILRFAPLQSIGRWSYSIYLWHWPIVGLMIYFGTSQSVSSLILGLIASIALGALSYRFVEKQAAKENNTRTTMLLLTATGAVAFAAVVVDQSAGFPTRSKGNIQLVYDSLAAPKDWAYPRPCSYDAIAVSDCTIGQATSKRRIAIFGDSHAEMLYPRFRSTAPADLLIEFVTSTGCPPIPRLDHLDEGSRCSRYHERALNFLKDTSIDRIVYVSIWTTYFEARTGMCFRTNGRCEPITADTNLSRIFDGLYTEIAELTKLGRQIYIVLPFPFPYIDVPKAIREREFKFENGGPLKYDARPELEASISRYLEKAASLGAVIIDPKSHLCINGACAFTDGAGRSLFTDSNHIRATEILTSRFDFLDTLLK
jgi:peptidoglycan/LPS O-acetylase OafA/YrhL